MRKISAILAAVTLMAMFSVNSNLSAEGTRASCRAKHVGCLYASFLGGPFTPILWDKCAKGLIVCVRKASDHTACIQTCRETKKDMIANCDLAFNKVKCGIKDHQCKKQARQNRKACKKFARQTKTDCKRSCASLK